MRVVRVSASAAGRGLLGGFLVVVFFGKGVT